MQWIQYYQLPSIPIHSYIALAEPSTIIRVKGDEEAIAKYVMKAEEIILRILQMEKTYEVHHEKNLQRRNIITSMIMKNVKDFSIDVMKKYNIGKNELSKGTRCIECNIINMTYSKGKWTCQNCKVISKNAHDTTLHDFFMLYKNDMNIQEAMQFLGLDNRHKAYRILKKSNVTYRKSTKSWIWKN